MNTLRTIPLRNAGEHEQFKHTPMGQRCVNLSGPTVGEYMTRMSAQERWLFYSIGGVLPKRVLRKLKVASHMELLGRHPCGI